MLDLALEEKLDELDPLRHLRDDPDLDSDDYTNLDSIVPSQPPSILDQTIELTFPYPTNTESHDRHANVAIRLAVDASPGCGGIAWPAGEVRSPRVVGAAEAGLMLNVLTRRFSRAISPAGVISENRRYSSWEAGQVS